MVDEVAPQTSKASTAMIASMLNNARNCNVMSMASESELQEVLMVYFGSPEELSDDDDDPGKLQLS